MRRAAVVVLCLFASNRKFEEVSNDVPRKSFFVAVYFVGLAELRKAPCLASQ
jgi:hypothetical protein